MLSVSDSKQSVSDPIQNASDSIQSVSDPIQSVSASNLSDSAAIQLYIAADTGKLWRYNFILQRYKVISPRSKVISRQIGGDRHRNTLYCRDIKLFWDGNT